MIKKPAGDHGWYWFLGFLGVVVIWGFTFVVSFVPTYTVGNNTILLTLPANKSIASISTSSTSPPPRSPPSRSPPSSSPSPGTNESSASVPIAVRTSPYAVLSTVIANAPLPVARAECTSDESGQARRLFARAEVSAVATVMQGAYRPWVAAFAQGAVAYDVFSGLASSPSLYVLLRYQRARISLSSLIVYSIMLINQAYGAMALGARWCV